MFIKNTNLCPKYLSKNKKFKDYLIQILFPSETYFKGILHLKIHRSLAKRLKLKIVNHYLVSYKKRII